MMKKTTDQPTPAPAGNEAFRELFHGAVRGLVREGLLQIIKDEVELLCGPSYRPSAGGQYRRAGTEPVRIRTSEGAEFIAKRRVRQRQPDGREQEVRLNSYAEIKRRKGMFDEVLEAICHGASGRGVGQMLGVSASQVWARWQARSRELLAEFRGRDLAPIAVLSLLVDGPTLPKLRVFWTMTVFGELLVTVALIAAAAGPVLVIFARIVYSKSVRSTLVSLRTSGGPTVRVCAKAGSAAARSARMQ